MEKTVEQRIDEATEEARRQKEAAGFLQGLTPNDEIIRPIYHPEAYIIRDKLQAAAKRGALPRTKCTHPISQIVGLLDFDVGAKRSERPVNIFECQLCHQVLWLRDAWGEAVSDG